MRAGDPIRFTSFGGYRRFCAGWWRDVWRSVTVGWWYDVRTYWHRARRGWAPRDTWSLDAYLAQVMGGAIAHLADTASGAPSGYPDGGEVTDHERWRDDLNRWAYAFAHYAHDDYYDKHGGKPGFADWNADEAARREALHAALKEMEPWFGALWN